MYSRSTVIIAAAIVVGTAASAGASDVYQAGLGGSIKDNAIETILVPEAVEIPDTASWYLRGDLNYGVTADVDISAGLPGIVDPDGVFGFSLGFGRYLSPNTRMDFTYDFKQDEQVFNFSGVRTHNVAFGGDTYTVVVSDNDLETLQSHTALANFYYDFDRMSRFRPYVGGGVGIAIHEVTRRRQATEQSCAGVIDVACAALPSNIRNDLSSSLPEDTNVSVGFAVAGQVGFSYEVATGVNVDSSYRVTYESAGVTVTSGNNDIHIGDRIDQEVRIGLRYDIW